MATIQLPVHPFIHLSISHLSDYISIQLATHPSYLSIHPCIYHLPICMHYTYHLANYPCILLVIHLSSIQLSINVTRYPFIIYVPTHLMYLSIHPFIYLLIYHLCNCTPM